MSTSPTVQKKQRRLSPDQKWQIIREARQGGMSISAVCAKYGIAPKQFYQWERQAEQGALRGLEGLKRGRKKTTAEEEELQAEVSRLQAVVAELSVENLQLKKGRWR